MACILVADIEMESLVIDTEVRDCRNTVLKKNEVARFFQFQENLHINFTVKEEGRYRIEIKN